MCHTHPVISIKKMLDVIRNKVLFILKSNEERLQNIVEHFEICVVLIVI